MSHYCHKGKFMCYLSASVTTDGGFLDVSGWAWAWAGLAFPLDDLCVGSPANRKLLINLQIATIG